MTKPPKGKTTPTPWELYSGHLIRAVIGEEAFPIAELRPPYRRGVGIVRGHYEESANGEFIVRAVNAHADLVEVLNEAVAYFDDAPKPSWVAKARAALSLAGGGSRGE